MKQVSTKKRGAILACSALMAISLTGGLAFLHGGEVSANAEDTGKILYYVDAGHFVKGDDAATTSGRGEGGSPSSRDTAFMTTYGLTYGLEDNGTRLYNSNTDQLFGEDSWHSWVDGETTVSKASTGKRWGFITPEADANNKNYGDGSWWRTGKTNANETIYDGYNTARHINEGPNNMGEGTLVYKFEVDDNTTPLKITFGTRTYDSGWNASEFDCSVNSLTAVKVQAKKGETSEYVTTNLFATDTIVGVAEGEGDDAKNFVTLTLGEAAGQNTVYLNWIMVSTADYELPVAYTLPTFVKSDATAVTATPSDGTDAVEATITEESKAALAAAAPLSEVGITVNIDDNKTATSTVTVIPASTKYFVNVGDQKTYDDVMKADGEYTAANGYGYIQEGSKAHSGQSYPGSKQWEGDAYNISCRADMDTIVYRFDVTGSSYGVVLGIVEHWAQWPINGGRKSEVSVNGGAGTLLTLPIENNAGVHGVAYGDPVDGKLDVKIDTRCSEANVISYILVYEHEHDASLTHHEAVASTCTTHGTVEYYTCETCGQNYSDTDAMTLVTNTEAALLSHTAVAHEQVSATCEGAGTEAYWTCSVCEKLFSDENCATEISAPVAIEALGHTYGELVAEVAATCSAVGTKAHYTCSACNKSFDEEKTELTELTIEKLPHTYSNVEWGEWDMENHTITYTAVCSECNDEAAAAQATVTSEVTTAPGCETAGVRTYTATAGTHTTTTTEAVPATGHTAVHHDAVAATCTATGTEEYWTCENCDKLFSDAACETEIEAAVVTEKIAHTIAHVEAVAPTIEQAGNEEYWQCSVCETLFSDENGETEIDEIPVIPAQHTLVHHDAVAATCTTVGNSEYWECEVCHKLFSDENGATEIEAVPTIAAGHTLVHHDAVAATCEKAGSDECWICSVCEKMYSDEACATEITATPTVAALGHDYTATWTWNGTEAAKVKLVCKHDATHTKEATATVTSAVTKEATEDEEGVTTYTAKVTIDGKEYTDAKTAPIEKLEGGCGSAMSVGALSGLAGLAAVCALVCLRKKEKNN